MADRPQVNDEAALFLSRTSGLLLFYVRKLPNHYKANINYSTRAVPEG